MLNGALMTISGKTFAGSPVNACSVEPDSGIATGGVLGVTSYNPPSPIEPQVTSYLGLFLTFFVKRWILLLLFLKQVPATV